MILNQLIEIEQSKLDNYRRQELVNPAFMPIHLTGGIGDVIMAIDTIRILQRDFKIAVYTKHTEAFKYFYKEYVPLFEMIPNYTWKLELHTYAKFVFSSNFYGFADKNHEKLFLQQQQLFNKEPKLEALIHKYPDEHYLLSRYAKHKRREFALWSLGYEEIVPYEIHRSKHPNYKQYITIHDGFDVQYKQQVKGRSTKQWSISSWNKLVKKLKKLNYKIVQIGSDTSRPIEGVDESFVGKTTIKEAFDILSQSALHIDGDSGMVHAATRLNVDCVVLWGPTPDYFYGYRTNENITSKVCDNACYGLKKDWMSRCPIGYKTPKCMDAITPKKVWEVAQLVVARHC